MLYISLLNNITLLVSLSVVNTLLLRYLRQGSKRYWTLSGLLYGVVAVIGMLNSVELLPGIIFDGRSIILVTAGVFGGPAPVLIAMMISSAFRILIGGAGTLMGVLVIIESGLFGMGFYYLRNRYKWASWTFSYFLLGFIVHVVMLILSVTLPQGASGDVFSQILLPVLIIYPFATLLLFLLFQSQENYLGLTKRLYESESQLKEANIIAGLGRWEYDPRTGKLEWSDTIFDIFEIDNAQFDGSYATFLAAIHPDDRHPVDEAYRRSLKNREPYDIEHRLLMKDGRIKWVFEKCRTDYDKNGNPVRSVGVVQEITDRKLAGIALEESKQMLRMIIDTIPVRVFWKNTECRYLGCNLPFARDAGLIKPEELIGLDDYAMGWKEEADLYRADDFEVMKTGKPKLDFEEQQTTPDGGKIWLKTSKLPLTDINGNIIGVLGTYEDITQRKQMEKDLIIARDRAEESDRLKTAFLNNLSHEIRTPMNAIVGFSELLNKPGISASEIRHYQQILHHSSGQLLAIIDDIFDIAAIETGQVKVFMRNTNVNQLLGLVFDQFLLRATRKNLDLILDSLVPDNDAVIFTDETKLNQVLNNLLGNAIKFTREGKVVFGCAKKNSDLEFFIRDTGIGIPAEMHEKIFEKFRQGDQASSGEFGGSGLGLFIVRSHVELLGGKIWLNSYPDSGTEFFFTVPVKEPVAAKLVEPSVRKPKLSARKTILIAEDNSANFVLLCEYLNGSDIEIIHAGNGKDAVDHCYKNFEIDLVVMDIKMPVMDGLTATGLIRKIRPELPIIALTAYAQAGDREKAIQNGCADYLAKPVDRNSFIFLVSKYLSGNQDREN